MLVVLPYYWLSMNSLIPVELDSSRARAYVLDFPTQNAEKRHVITYCRRVSMCNDNYRKS